MIEKAMQDAMNEQVNKELDSFLIKHSAVKTDAELLLRVMLECL